MLRVKISVFCVGGKSRENQSNWVVWMLKGVNEEADFKAVLIALPQQGQPDFAWAGSEELKQADPHTLLHTQIQTAHWNNWAQGISQCTA